MNLPAAMPLCPPPVADALAQHWVQQMAELMRGRRTAVLTGAGCSTESGIPDYRGPETRRRARSPMRLAEFEKDKNARKRYWARAIIGYRKFENKQPNPAHHALVALERAGLLSGLITQNVDDLHERAGQRTVLPLHGSLSQVHCMACAHIIARSALQRQLTEQNPDWASVEGAAAPDGDADIAETDLARFQLVDCPRCAGPLKPSVVFFGENVPRERVATAYGICDDADLLMVVGSSLAVFSGYRFARRTTDQGKPLILVNVGESRGDGLSTLRAEGPAGQLLPALSQALT